MKKVIITGASGLVATELTMLLLKRRDVNLFLLSRNPETLEKRYADRPNVACFTVEGFRKFCRGREETYDCLIHTAFSRSSDGRLICQSLAYTQEVLDLARLLNVKAFVNVSSQSVYGQETPPLWREDTLLAPNYLYALGKVAEEMLVETVLCDTGIKFTSLRLSSVCENARFLNVFVKNALEGLPIKVLGGNQVCSFIDVRDVATALERVIEKTATMRFDRVYNLGTNQTYTIWELAKQVQKVAEKRYGLEVKVEREEKDIQMNVGMDSGKFMRVFSWRPEKSVEDMIISLFEYLMDVKMGRGKKEFYPISFRILYGSYEHEKS